MKNGKYAKRRGVATKTLVLALAVMLIVGCTIGGTLAWLTAETDQVVNTFTVGDINITLAESDDLDLKMVPGNTITKDPVVTVSKDSEDCWLFVKIEESSTLRTYINYSIATGWTTLSSDTVNGVTVIYREVAASESDQTFSVLADDQVTVKDSVTKDLMEALSADGATQPTLTFTAYAVQKDNINDVNNAWYVALNGTLPSAEDEDA